jgi:hypothetical protein
MQFEKDNISKESFFVMFLILSISIVLSFSRMAIIAFISILLLYYRNRIRITPKFLIFVIPGILIGMFFFMKSSQGEKIIKRTSENIETFNNFLDDKPIGANMYGFRRIELMTLGVKLIKDNFFFWNRSRFDKLF